MGSEVTFGMIAKNRRRELGLTQDELARRVGCAPITLRKIEADDLRPSVQIAERMAMALNIPLEERAAFVKLARVDRAPVEEPKVTPMPEPNEIGIDDLTGRAIRGYALGERLGNGGMGVVYRAVQPLVEREVAIKIILPRYANHPDFIRRFEAEAQLVARLEHPHIVPLYDYWREPSVAYLIMRLLRGGSVQSLLRNGSAISPEIVLRMMEQIGSALSSAHRAGVVHRDLKPANVLLDEDNNAYLADFGIAKNLSSPSSDTQADMVIGSPDYISPEQIRSEYIRPQTDIYALGVMLYELLTGKVPFNGPTPFEVMHQHLSTPLPPLAANRAGLPKSLDAVIEHATAKDPLQRYETVDTMVNDLRKALGVSQPEIKSSTLASQATVIPARDVENPYKGLRAFSEGDAQDFFGREALTQQLLVRLGEGGELARFLAVVGPSGSGKSSVVKAGLIPALRRGALPGSENWFIIEMMPGSHPLEELEAALLRVAVNPPASLIEQFQKDKRGLIRAVRRSLPDDPNIELVLVIDQFEEVFTLLQDENERQQFLGLLVSTILDEQSRVRLVLTLRADFIDRPLSYVDFGELMHQRMELILPLTPDELESAITAPAGRVGLHFESGLVAAILHDLGDQPGTLPLLQYALTELYEKRVGNALTKSAYQEIGGVLGALGRRAEDVFNGLDAESQTIARQIFLRLVTLGEGVEDTRRRALIAELENLRLNQTLDPKNFLRSIQKVLDAFGHARLLSFDRDPDTRGPTVEVAHEAIIREWTRLREWLDESRSLVRLQRQLALEASEWLEENHDTSYLLTGAKLAQYEGWIDGSEIALTQDEINYLKASIAFRAENEANEMARQKRELETAQKLVETERSSALRLRNRNRVISAVGVIVIVLALIAGIFAQRNGTLAEQNASSANTAQAAEAKAQVNFTRAEAQRLAVEANNLLKSNGSSELIALLSLRSMNIQYSPQGDAAVAGAATLNYPKQIFVGHTNEVSSVAFSSDGKFILTGSLDGTARLWDVQTGKELRKLAFANGNKPSPIGWVTFSPDNRSFLTMGNSLVVSNSLLVQLWDIKTKGEVQIFATDYVPNVAVFSQDGKYIFIGLSFASVEVFDVQTGEAVHKYFFPSPARSVLYISPDGKYAITRTSLGEGTVQLWNLDNTISKLQEFTYSAVVSGAPENAAVSPDGKFMLIGYIGGDIVLWDIVSGKIIRTFIGHSAEAHSLAFSSDGKYILSGGFDKTARLWDVKTGRELLRLNTTGAVNTVAFSPNEQSVLTGSSDGTVQLWDIHPRHELSVFTSDVANSEGVSLSAVTFSPDGKLLATGGTDGLKLWDVETGRLQRAFTNSGFIKYGVEFSPDGLYLLSGNYASSTASLWDARTGEQLQQFIDPSYNAFNFTDYLNDIAFSPDSKTVVSGNGYVVNGWEEPTGHPAYQIPGYSFITRLVFSPDGKSLLTASTSGKITLYETQFGNLIKSFIGAAALNGAAFSPDGKYIATASLDKMAHLWDVESGEEIRQFIGHTDILYSVAFSPDGKTIATSSADGTARLWDVQTGQELRRFIGHTAGVQNVAFSPDGKYIATVSDDGTARLWDIDYHTTIDYLCAVLLRDLTDAERVEYNITDPSPTCPKP